MALRLPLWFARRVSQGLGPVLHPISPTQPLQKKFNTRPTQKSEACAHLTPEFRVLLLVSPQHVARCTRCAYSSRHQIAMVTATYICDQLDVSCMQAHFRQSHLAIQAPSFALLPLADASLALAARWSVPKASTDDVGRDPRSS